MRLLLIDHGSCDPPTTRVHPLRSRLASEGFETLVCGPASVSNLLGQTPGLHGIHLLDIAAAKLGIDPLEIRRRNVIPDDAFPTKAASGVKLASPPSSADHRP